MSISSIKKKKNIVYKDSTIQEIGTIESGVENSFPILAIGCPSDTTNVLNVHKNISHPSITRDLPIEATSVALKPDMAKVTKESTQIIPSRIIRKGLIIKHVTTIENSEKTMVSLGFGYPAILKNGITLFPGDEFVMNDRTFSTAVINAIADDNCIVSIQEWTN